MREVTNYQFPPRRKDERWASVSSRSSRRDEYRDDLDKVPSMTPSPLVEVDPPDRRGELRITIISHRASPLVGLLNFSVAPEGERGPESEPAGFAFRQPLASRFTPRRNSSYSFVRPAPSFSRARRDHGRERRAALFAQLRSPPSKLRQTPFTVATRLVDPSFGAYPPVTFPFPRTAACKQSVLTCTSPRALPKSTVAWTNVMPTRY